MTRMPPPDLPEHKPIEEMTREEQREYAAELRRLVRRELAELNRPKRERKLRRGLVRPRNRAELEIFAKDVTSGRERRGGRRPAAGKAVQPESLPVAEALEMPPDEGTRKGGRRP